jgi:GR25 family glycosyltransferase involved in LPS biosynthesis
MMKHADIWYEMAEQNVNLGLILEDDAIFVPFFKEKFSRTIFAALRSGALRLNTTCTAKKQRQIHNHEWIDQNPMIVIGSCSNLHDQSFEKNSSDAQLSLSTHKSDASRCTHAYLLTSCSAQALVDQLQAQKNDFWPSDSTLNNLFSISPTLQSFWMDPPLAYQGNQVTDIDNITTFKMQTHAN